MSQVSCLHTANALGIYSSPDRFHPSILQIRYLDVNARRSEQDNIKTRHSPCMSFADQPSSMMLLSSASSWSRRHIVGGSTDIKIESGNAH